MAFLDTRGLYTLYDLMYDTFALRKRNKFFSGEDSTPSNYVTDNSLYVQIGEPFEVLPIHGDGVLSINGFETDGLTGNVQLPGYLARYTWYKKGDTALSMKLPGGYYLECVTQGYTGDEEIESYAKDSSSSV
jgi:hypothetical protein